MSVKLEKYLTAFNSVAAAVLANSLPEEEKREALALVANAGTERLIDLNLRIEQYRSWCVLSYAERVAMSAEGCTIRLRPPKPHKKKTIRGKEIFV